jgi:hypothetical protein
MEFDAVIKQAIDKNPTIARAVTNINRAETLLQQARAFTLPTLSTSITNATLDSARSFGSGTIQPRNQTVIGASAAVPVLAASRWANLQQARDQIVVAEASTAEVASRSWWPRPRRTWRSRRHTGRWMCPPDRSSRRARISTMRRSGSRAAPAAG